MNDERKAILKAAQELIERIEEAIIKYKHAKYRVLNHYSDVKKAVRASVKKEYEEALAYYNATKSTIGVDVELHELKQQRHKYTGDGLFNAGRAVKSTFMNYSIVYDQYFSDIKELIDARVKLSELCAGIEDYEYSRIPFLARVSRVIRREYKMIDIDLESGHLSLYHDTDADEIEEALVTLEVIDTIEASEQSAE